MSWLLCSLCAAPQEEMPEKEEEVDYDMPPALPPRSADLLEDDYAVLQEELEETPQPKEEGTYEDISVPQGF